jgi:hypothetical protein
MWKEVDAPGSSGERGGGAAAAGEEKEEKEEQEEEERGWNLEMVLAGAWWLVKKWWRSAKEGSIFFNSRTDKWFCLSLLRDDVMLARR